MIPAHQLASRPDAFGQTLTGHLDWIWVSFAQYDPCFLWKNGAETCRKSDLAYTIRPDSDCTLAIMAPTGCNQNASGSDPAWLLGWQSRHGMYNYSSDFFSFEYCSFAALSHWFDNDHANNLFIVTFSIHCAADINLKCHCAGTVWTLFFVVVV